MSSGVDENRSRNSSAIAVLDTDLLSIILAFLDWPEVLPARVCRQWSEAAKLANVTELNVRNRDIGLQLPWMSQSLANLESFKIDFGTSLSKDFDIQDGEEAEPTLRLPTVEEGYEPPAAVDLSPIQNFTGLQRLSLRQTRLNGKYPFLFQFKSLVSLDLLWNTRLKWDLDMLAGLPNLQRLYCPQNHSLTGNIASVRALSATLTELTLCYCQDVTGSLEDVYDLPLLEILSLEGTKVEGDIRAIGESAFPALKHLDLSDHVYGGGTIQKIAEAASLMEARYQFMKQFPDVSTQRLCRLADDSPDRYYVSCHQSRAPPFWTEFVKVGPRMGWRWTNAAMGGCCEINWLDPEPHPTDELYEEYCKKLVQDDEKLERGFFRGFHRPPSEVEYRDREAEIPLDYSMLFIFGNPLW